MSHDHLLMKQIKQHLIQQNLRRMEGDGEEEYNGDEADEGGYAEAYGDEEDEEDEEREQEEYDEHGRLLSLSLRDAGLRQIPPEIWEFTSLQKLDLGKNQLRTVPAELGQLTNLQWLILSDNQLSSLPAELGQLVNLWQLELADNGLSGLPAEVGQLVNLQCLYLRDNLLSSLPVELSQLPKLTVLDLSLNPLLEMPPPEVVWQGCEAILAYLRDQKDVKRSWGRLETERLVLRHLYPTDAPALLEMLLHEEVRRYDNIPPLSSLVDVQSIIVEAHAMFANQRGMRLAITLKESGQLVGVCGYVCDRENALADLSGELAYAYWGQGLMSEALQAIIQFGFSEKQMHRMECQVVVENAASVRLFQKLGFQAEGILKERLFINGQFRDMQSFALLRQDFVMPFS